MWNDHRSLILSKVCVVIFMLALLAVVCSAPWLVQWLIGFSRARLVEKWQLLLATVYTGAIPAAILLHSLLRLLQRISASQVFLSENVEHLRRISWSCFMGAAVCSVSALYYLPWVLVAVAAAFMGLIVRVVKNVVAQAVALQDEVDYTI
ncbi:MAG: DUF2975 domain-containing protein [Bacillota bacterium]|jgi:hypothetical protein